MIRMKDSLVLKKIFGWALTALLAVEGYFSAFCFVSGCFGIRKLLYGGYGGGFDFSAALYLLLPPIILTVTIWAGKKFTGISNGKYALMPRRHCGGHCGASAAALCVQRVRGVLNSQACRFMRHA